MAGSGDLVAIWEIKLSDGVHHIEFEHGNDFRKTSCPSQWKGKRIPFAGLTIHLTFAPYSHAVCDTGNNFSEYLTSPYAVFVIIYDNSLLSCNLPKEIQNVECVPSVHELISFISIAGNHKKRMDVQISRQGIF